MAALTAHKTHKQFSGGLELVEVEYDFAKDGGATGALDIITFPEESVIVDAYAKVKTACVSSGNTATLIYGIKGGDTDAFLDVTSGAEANLTAGAVLANETTGRYLKIAEDDVIEMTIGTEALTGGKVVFCFLVQKF